MDAYAIHSLTFSYPGQGKKALDNVSLTIPQGQFAVLCGPSGCGKTTLLRHLKTVFTPHGMRSGSVLFEGKSIADVDMRTQSTRIGFVAQNPDNQIVTDKVWHELAFGLESLGLDTPSIRSRVAEMAGFFGIGDWFYKNVSELSGGQKQLLSLASVMAMQPSVLILDEPTGQLDPVAASEFLTIIGRINRELGTTVIMTEHRLEEAFALADRVVVMENGLIIADGSPKEVGGRLRDKGHSMFLAMPSAMRIWAAVPNELDCPVTVREGREWLDAYMDGKNPPEYDRSACKDGKGEVVLEAEDVWYRYSDDLPDIVKGLSLKLHRGEFLSVLGGNGAGKTTSLFLLAGRRNPHRGKVRQEGRIAMLPQAPQSLFVKKTVREDLADIYRGRKISRDEKERGIARVTHLCMLNELLDRHPYDLSGGEQQRAALAKVLLLDPDILMLDEPTKGLDAEYKQILAVILKTLLKNGVGIMMVSHDIEFCAEHSHRCAMLFDGELSAALCPEAFFSGNSFYTTSAGRIARSRLPGLVTVPGIIRACGGNAPPEPELPDYERPVRPPRPDEEKIQRSLPLWRKLLAGAGATAAAVAFLHSTGLLRFPSLSGSEYGTYAVLVGALFLLAFSIAGRSEAPISADRTEKGKRRLSKRTAAAALMILLLIPLTIYIGVFYLGDRKYYFISLLVMLECMLPFFLIFEGRKPQARELVTIAVLCALAVAGRAAFFMLPQFKPVMAMVIISGVAFGGEAGFLVGAVTMLASNVMFGQGPWTPWQMFAMGIIGFLAGVLFRKGLLRRTRLSLSVFGAVCAILIYGGIMNPASALMWSREVNWKIILTYYATGFPMDLIQSAATAFFLWFLSKPMLEKLDRVKEKYGLIG